MILGCKLYRGLLKGFSQKKLLEAVNERLLPMTKPDLSNCIKAIEDGFTKVIWHDDNQVVKYTEATGKYYGDPVRIEIEIWELVEEKVNQTEIF